MLSTLLELAGAGLLIAFALVVWPPAALALAGLGLLVVAQAVRR